MVLGMTLETYTKLHVVISLIGIVSGLVVVFGMLNRQLRDGWTSIFVWSTVLTSVTGFGFPFDHLLPSHKVGIVSLIVLVVVIVARSRAHREGVWRWIFPLGCVLAPVPERVRAGGAVVPGDPGPERAGADPVGAAVPARAARGLRPLRLVRGRLDEAVPPLTGAAAPRHSRAAFHEANRWRISSGQQYSRFLRFAVTGPLFASDRRVAQPAARGRPLLR